MGYTTINNLTNENVNVFFSLDFGLLFLFIFIGTLYLFITYKKKYEQNKLKEYILYLNNKFLIFIIMINSFIVFSIKFTDVDFEILKTFLSQLIQNLIFYSFVTFSIIGMLYLISYIMEMYKNLNLFGNKYINDKSINKKGGKK